MSERVAVAGVKKAPGFLYFIDKQGDVSRSPMARSRTPGPRGQAEKVAKTGVKKEKGYLYFLDKQGDVSRAKAKSGAR